jgi:hypothetical protein
MHLGDDSQGELMTPTTGKCRAPAEEPTDAEDTTAAQDQPAQEPGSNPCAATLNLPFVTAQFRAPARQELSSVLHTVRSVLPPPRKVVYLGGLAALAALEVIDWPVAAAIAIGTAIAGSDSGSRSAQSPTSHQPENSETSTE